MSNDSFIISLSIASTLERDEVSKITGSDPERFSPAGAVVSPWRSAEESIWLQYPPLHSANLDDELTRIAARIRSFQPSPENFEITVSVVFRKAGEGFFPVIIQGETVSRLLELGVQLDFDDVLYP